MGDINKWLIDQIDSNLIPNLMGFVRIPNQSRNFDPDWQTDGLNLKVCQYVKDWADSQKVDNLTIEILQEEGRTPCVLAILEPSNFSKTADSANVLMYGHLDKQPPLTDQWSPGLKPYDPVIKDNKLYGRGGADDGYAFFACVLILKALQTFKQTTNRVVLFFETDEESDSKDLIYFLEKNAQKIGQLDLVVCLDSGCCDYDHWCLTTTLRGVINFTLKVEVTKEGVHSGMASGIIPDSFRIGRKLLEKFESSESGQLYVQDLYVNIPDDKYQEAFSLIKEMGGAIDWKFPFLPGVQPTVSDGFKQYMNRIWMPQLTLIGMDGVPNVSNAGNVLRPYTTFGLSLRLPPTLAGQDAQKSISDFFANVPKPYNAKVTVEFSTAGQGFNSPPLTPDLKKVIDDAGQQSFGKPVLKYGEGGSIPFINQLYQKFPNSQFIITGVLGPESNAHGPDEFLHIPFLKKLSCALAAVLPNVKKTIK